jgi:dihydrofolate reductase
VTRSPIRPARLAAFSATHPERAGQALRRALDNRECDAREGSEGMRKLTYYLGSSLDGFIAAPDGSIDAFPVTQDVIEFMAADYPETLPTHLREQLGVTAPGRRFDTVVMGRNTYAPALQAAIVSPFAHLDQYVVSTTLPASPDPRVQVVAGDPIELVGRLKHRPGAGIWLAGGARLAGALLGEIDELVIKRYPVVLGAGIPFSMTGQVRNVSFELVDDRVLPGGTTVARYTRTA